MSRVRARRRKIKIAQKQRRKGKLRKLRAALLLARTKDEKEKLLAKMQKISPFVVLDVSK